MDVPHTVVQADETPALRWHSNGYCIVCEFHYDGAHEKSDNIFISSLQAHFSWAFSINAWPSAAGRELARVAGTAGLGGIDRAESSGELERD